MLKPMPALLNHFIETLLNNEADAIWWYLNSDFEDIIIKDLNTALVANHSRLKDFNFVVR